MNTQATTTRDLVRIAERSAASVKASAHAYIAPQLRRRLRVMELRDGRARLIDGKGAVFLLCASKRIAQGMRAVFSP